MVSVAVKVKLCTWMEIHNHCSDVASAGPWADMGNMVMGIMNGGVIRPLLAWSSSQAQVPPHFTAEWNLINMLWITRGGTHYDWGLEKS